MDHKEPQALGIVTGVPGHIFQMSTNHLNVLRKRMLFVGGKVHILVSGIEYLISLMSKECVCVYVCVCIFIYMKVYKYIISY